MPFILKPCFLKYHWVDEPGVYTDNTDDVRVERFYFSVQQITGNSVIDTKQHISLIENSMAAKTQAALTSLTLGRVVECLYGNVSVQTDPQFTEIRQHSQKGIRWPHARSVGVVGYSRSRFQYNNDRKRDCFGIFSLLYACFHDRPEDPLVEHKEFDQWILQMWSA